MNKKLTRLKITALIVTLVQVILIGIFLTLYILDVWEMSKVIRIEYIIYACFGLAVIDGIIIWSMIYSFHKIAKLNDNTTKDIIGNDINEAYLFGKVGVFLCDENGIILWVSDLFLERQMNYINQNIYECFPKLKDFDSNLNINSLNIRSNGYDYSVKYLKSSNLYIFKDVSDYENLSRYSRAHAIVLGTILIDNYADITLNDDDNNDLILKVRTEIMDYFRQFDVTLRHTKNDTYFAVCTFESLEKMEKDKFSILDTVKQCGTGESIIPTLSMCFAYEFPNINKLNENVNNGLQVALARGGDQAVVSKFGSDLRFYGGRTEASENKNKVRVRVLTDTLKTLITRASKVILMGHTDMDMDALGACLGMRAICNTLDKEAYIVFDSKNTERKTRSALTSLYARSQLEHMVVSPKGAEDLIDPSTLIIVLDVSKPSRTMCPRLLELTDKVVVVDHHRRGEEFIYNPVFSYIEPSASSTCEIIGEFIKYGSYQNEVKLSPIDATIMLSGIFLDTTFFKNKSVGLRAFEGSMILKEYGADNSLAYDLLKDEYEEYLMVSKIVTNRKNPAYGIVFCMASESDIIDTSILAKAANQCMELKGTNAVFAIGKTSDKEVRVSARSDGSVNVQILCEKFGGGGHFAGGGAIFKNATIKEVESQLTEALNENLSDIRITNGEGE